MKTAVIVILAFVAMATAQEKVRVVEQPDQVRVVDNNPGQTHPQQPSIDPAFIVDPAYYRPSNPPNGGYEPISTGPALVENRPPYPYKQYSFPGARGGK